MPCKPPKVKKNHSGIIIPLFIVVLDKKVFFATIWSNIIMGVKMKNHDWENTNFDDMNSDDTNSYGVNPYKHIEFSEKNAKLNEKFYNSGYRPEHYYRSTKNSEIITKN